MLHYNGVTLLTSSLWALPDAVLATDACLTGLGGTAFDQCFRATFPSHILDSDFHIAGLEALAVSVALKLWAPRLAGLRNCILCDNLATVTVLNLGRAKDPFLLRCMREICFTSALHQFQVKAQHIAGVDNRLPDYLSRWDSDRSVRKLFLNTPGARSLTMITVPEQLFSFDHTW